MRRYSKRFTSACTGPWPISTTSERVARRSRLDVELVRRGLARSREQARELVEGGRVKVAGLVAEKPATQVDPATPVTVVEVPGEPPYASRGGRKLAGALDRFVPQGLVVAGRRCLDAGASTGGFTDVLLRAEAASVVAVDVGYGQLAWSLRTDSRVHVLDRTNVRNLTAADLPDGPVSLVVADLSFISLGLVLPALRACAEDDGDFILMVKPQFEVGRDRIGSGGVVRDPQERSDAVRSVADRAAELDLGVAGITASPLPGPAGNVEYFVWLRTAAPPLDLGDLRRAVMDGPP
jgi:23S rRNA (cytidine1920-2'-O)/16S rRNA (cytidine1409-2'-O)-methyltransferase